jgi:hypothetical protein
MARRYLAPNPLTDTMETGSAAFASLWRAWMSQFTQPQLMRISDAYLGDRLFHSSQMGGFATRKLRQPGPLVFLAVGYLNTAHGRSLGIPADRIETVPDIGLPDKLPDTLRSLWDLRDPLCDANGTVMGPTGLFEAFSGLRALSVSGDRVIAPENEAAASQAIGRILRLKLGANGIDWLSELPRLRTQCNSLEPLLMGKTCSGDQLVVQLPRLAAIAGTTEDDLWARIEESLAQPEIAPNLPT